MIGNGWIDPAAQYASFLPYIDSKHLVQENSNLAVSLKQQDELCKEAIRNLGARIHIPECEAILQRFLDGSRGHPDIGARLCYNMYDVRLFDTYPDCGMNWPPDIRVLTKYLREPAVERALNVAEQNKRKWVECSGAVGNYLKAKHSRPSMELLPDLLEELQVLLFSGDNDLICNHIGTETLIKNLIAPLAMHHRTQTIRVGKELVGDFETFNNLTYARFYNASHMVPFDTPRGSLEILNKFLDSILVNDQLGGWREVNSTGSPIYSELADVKLTNLKVGYGLSILFFLSTLVAFLLYCSGGLRTLKKPFRYHEIWRTDQLQESQELEHLRITEES